jgi:hypothetical protein
VLVISLLWQTVRIYPLGGYSSQKIVLGKEAYARRGAQTKITKTRAALLGFGDANYPLLFVTPHFGEVNEIDNQGRVVVATHQIGAESEVGMENERVTVRWHEDHIKVIAVNGREDWPPELKWIA